MYHFIPLTAPMTIDHQPDSSSLPLLAALRGVTVRLGQQTVLEGVDFQVRANEIVSLIGLNGAGKSTLVRTLLGLVKPVKGQVYRAPGLRIGYAPQHVRRDPVLPISVAQFLRLSARMEQNLMAEVLEEVGAARIAHHPMAEISGGELHRVLLARALLQRPQLLVLDEPLAGVDVASEAALYGTIARIRQRYGCAIVLVSHDLHLVMAATDTVVCLNRHVCCTGHPESVARHPEFVALFGAKTAQSLAFYHHAHDHRHDALGKPVPLTPDEATSL